ncbi:MAG: DUF4339 domain-containing protein [Bacteroidetes bacterium]|nr:DUF4339 domain-containing protein [Bacteroidota bacterium]MBS1631186.1 DUF4339 domain-containing protein [Bacteroidota bacterium]
MKKYFFHDGTSQHGPLSINELSACRITPQTLIWFDAIPQWKPAGEIPELQVLFNNTATSVPVNPSASMQEDWNSKDIYFMDNAGKQQGPYKLNQLAGKNITAQTQVWYEPLTKWTTAGEVAALNSVLNSTTAAINTEAQATQADWNSVGFYFIDNSGNQQGPLQLNQLAGKNITAQTQVWYESLPKWTTAGEIAALKSILNSTTTAAGPAVQAAQTDWNTVGFYFIDNTGKQQGPLQLNQLAGKNITAQTQVWYESLPKWTTAGEIAALKSILNSTTTTAGPAVQAAQTDWNRIGFYFIDNTGKQQGPLQLNQLAGKNITAQTQVWYESLPKWTTAGEIAALKNILGNTTTVAATTTPTTQTDWNNIGFYFLDNAGMQQGPFKLNQLAEKNITAQTQVWYDPLPKWTTAGEIAALKSVLENRTSVSAQSTATTAAETRDWSKKQFFIADSGGNQQGPFTLKQLEDKNISESTAVWYDPLPSWTTAGEVQALKQIIEAAKAKMEEWKNKFYFFSDATGTRQGPFKLDQLKDKNITAQTPIWYDPLTEWTTAGEIAALKEIIVQ